MPISPESTTSLVVAGIEILQDEHGRYNLNVLHAASPAKGRDAKKPGAWLKRKSAQELISELETQVSFSTLEVVHGGDRQGTYAHELLAISYAGWISPAFQLKVNQAFIDMRTGRYIPAVANPASQAMIDLIVRYDALEQRVKAGEERERERDKAIIAQQAEVIKALTQAETAETKADMALEDAHRFTIEEFIIGQKLLRQFPRHTWAAAGSWLGKFCKLWGMKVLPKPTPWKAWKEENAYPLQALSAWLDYEIRIQGQIRIEGIDEETP